MNWRWNGPKLLAAAQLESNYFEHNNLAQSPIVLLSAVCAMNSAKLLATDQEFCQASSGRRVAAKERQTNYLRAKHLAKSSGVRSTVNLAEI